MRSVETPTTELTLRDDGVVVAQAIKPETPRTVETVHVVMDALVEMVGENRRPILWDVRNSSIGSLESVAVFLRRAVESLSAIGLLIGKGADRELWSRVESFSPAVGSLLMPVRVFREETEAIAWLQGFVDPD